MYVLVHILNLWVAYSRYVEEFVDEDGGRINIIRRAGQGNGRPGSLEGMVGEKDILPADYISGWLLQHNLMPYLSISN